MLSAVNEELSAILRYSFFKFEEPKINFHLLKLLLFSFSKIFIHHLFYRKLQAVKNIFFPHDGKSIISIL